MKGSKLLPHLRLKGGAVGSESIHGSMRASLLTPSSSKGLLECANQAVREGCSQPSMEDNPVSCGSRSGVMGRISERNKRITAVGGKLQCQHSVHDPKFVIAMNNVVKSSQPYAVRLARRTKTGSISTRNLKINHRSRKQKNTMIDYKLFLDYSVL